MSDRIKAFAILFALTVVTGSAIGGLVWFGQWLDSEYDNIAKFILGAAIALASILVAVAVLVWMLIFYLSILEAIRSRRKRKNEQQETIPG